MKQIDNDTVLGVWCLRGDQLNYPTLKFNSKNMIELGSKMDTVYTYIYNIRGDYLEIKKYNEKINKNHILKLTKDSLILDGLLENTVPQIYYRCENEIDSYLEEK
jgi:ribosomal protein L33